MKLTDLRSQETNQLKAKIINKLTLTRANETKSVKGFQIEDDGGRVLDLFFKKKGKYIT